jgi:hypothetical protein
MIYRRPNTEMKMSTEEDKRRLEHLTTPLRSHVKAAKRLYIDWPAVVVYHLTLVIIGLVIWGIGKAIGL